MKMRRPLRWPTGPADQTTTLFSSVLILSETVVPVAVVAGLLEAAADVMAAGSAASRRAGRSPGSMECRTAYDAC